MSSIAEGFWYVADDDAAAAAGPAAGATVRVPARSPPWLVVDARKDRVVVARWPGRLFRVEVLDADGIEQPPAGAGYTRAAALRVVEELEAWTLFGEHGRSVAAVIAAASRATLADVETLARSRDPDAGPAYARSWQRWLTSLGVADAGSIGEDLDGTLAIPVARRHSPIGHGFSVLSLAFERRAEQLAGREAFVDYGDGERGLKPMWSSAACALLEAAMSFGSPECSRGDAPTLAAAWRAVVERTD